MQAKVRTEQTVVEEDEVSEEETYAEQLRLQEEEELANLKAFAEELASLDPDGAPTFEQLRGWKSSYGRFYMSNVTDLTDVFIWRPILRLEWKEMINSINMSDDLQRQEALIQRCLLYPAKDVVLYKKGAGYLSSLETAIMFQSGFVDERTIISSIKIIE